MCYFHNNVPNYNIKDVAESFRQADSAMADLLLEQAELPLEKIADLSFSSIGEKAVAFWSTFRRCINAAAQGGLTDTHTL